MNLDGGQGIPRLKPAHIALLDVSVVLAMPPWHNEAHPVFPGAVEGTVIVREEWRPIEVQERQVEDCLHVVPPGRVPGGKTCHQGAWQTHQRYQQPQDDGDGDVARDHRQGQGKGDGGPDEQERGRSDGAGPVARPVAISCAERREGEEDRMEDREQVQEAPTD
ncbi:hypothetical protein PG993_010480 [Apiospora rasikravindrae]|uniref:Uncharacterized protein n=1 Tax=Apiospora rasikravindrae TaxID=990691 RepID=A0ABR1SME2_9PEZI